MSFDVFVGIGGNLGDSAATVHLAMTQLAALPVSHLLQSSSLYRSAPITGALERAAGAPPEATGTALPFAGAPQPDYVNAVAKLETDLAPADLLASLLAIEARHGRQRSVADAPRTLDLDVLLYGDLVIAQPGLSVPHPRMHLRAFVLIPLIEIAPDCVIPGHGLARECLSRLPGQRVEVFA
jgi:2-amino-4-hydroxy-6-hydroxymethyldihydropteridine diphosphokinase